MNEASIVIYDHKIIAVSRGKPCEVEFDFDAVLEFKNNTPDFNPEKLTWFHTHPVGSGTKASAMDRNCAKGLAMAFGKIGSFVIVSFKDCDLNNIHGEGSMYIGGDLRYAFTSNILVDSPYMWMLKALSVVV